MASWLRRKLEGVENRALSRRWVRRVYLVLMALGLGFWPVYVTWRLTIKPSRDGMFLGSVVWEGIGFTLVVALLATDMLPQIGRRPVEALIAFVPVVGGIVLLIWCWRLADHWRSREERQAAKGRLLEALDPFDREVHKLRFDIDVDLHYSRRKTARILQATREQVAEAEARIQKRMDEAEHA